MVRVRVEPLAGEEQVAEAREVVAASRYAPAGSSFLIARNAVGAVNSVFTPCCGDHAPERARVGRPDRLALVEDRRAAGEERRVDDVGMADDPADVGGRPEHVARVRVVDVRHAPPQRDGVAAVVADDALRHAGRPRRVEDVERVGGGDRHARGRLGAVDQLAPVEVAARRPARPRPAARWRIDAVLRLVRRPARSRRRAAACTRSRGRPRCRRRPRGPTFGRASSIRSASSCGANPPNTTEWTAPSRAQASIAITASGTIGM